MRGRAQVMKMWGQDGRRPQAFWEFDSPVPFPGRDLEQSTLWRLGVFSADEKARVEARWRADFQRAQDPNFSYCLGPAEFLIGDLARKAHYKWCDIPFELVQKWSAELRQQTEKENPPAKLRRGSSRPDEPIRDARSSRGLCRCARERHRARPFYRPTTR
jgi:hypothetical protein